MLNFFIYQGLNVLIKKCSNKKDYTKIKRRKATPKKLASSKSLIFITSRLTWTKYHKKYYKNK
jgi:hypothetical protein